MVNRSVMARGARKVPSSLFVHHCYCRFGRPVGWRTMKLPASRAKPPPRIRGFGHRRGPLGDRIDTALRLRLKPRRKACCRHALRLADLYNWAGAASNFSEAERLFMAAGDERGALHARLGRLRATVEQNERGLLSLSSELADELDTNPLLKSDRRTAAVCSRRQRGYRRRSRYRLNEIGLDGSSDTCTGAWRLEVAVPGVWRSSVWLRSTTVTSKPRGQMSALRSWPQLRPAIVERCEFPVRLRNDAIFRGGCR